VPNGEAPAPIGDEKIGDFLDRLAARVPAPGGGAAAALYVALGAALLGMAARFTVGGRDDESQVTIGHIIAEVDELRALAVRLAEADVHSIAAVAAAVRLPASTEAEQAARAAAITGALVDAAWPSAKIISVAGMVVDIAGALAMISNRNVVSEIAGAAVAASAAAATARVNLEIGLADVHDEQASLEMIGQISKADEIVERANQVTAAVREQIRSLAGGCCPLTPAGRRKHR
jgi:methenyltetrahydrofolate cyclohydrolase